ncbi:anti-sigma factor domain-containing protein [Novosphingobium aquiterrae]|uniref:Anti-sigma factor domain-containing protein n=1 Tax=Novosphingobium aquiterrae TaxID=624388 RepID=A0ABV6PHP7_9SPHN
MSDDDDLMAAELALGLAGDPAAAARRAADPAFAERVAWWEMHFAGLTSTLGAEPSPDLWPRIAARLPQNDNPRGVLRWKLISGGLAVVSAVTLFMLAQRPQIELPPAPAAPAVASLSGEKGSALAISYDMTTRRLTVAPVQLDPGKGDAELWVIPVGSSEAVSLGVIDAHKPVTHQLAPAQARLVAAGATFAISLEPVGGSPTGHATGPIVASGKLVET